MAAEPVMRNADYMFADNHFVCRFTSETVVNEIRNVNEQLVPLFPLFPPFMPFDKVWEFTLDNDMYVDIIGMVLFVSSIGHKKSFYNRRIPVRNIFLLDGTVKAC